MSQIVHEEPDIAYAAAELQNLQHLLPSLLGTWSMTLLLAARILGFWALLKILMRKVKAVSEMEPIDPEGNLDAGLLRMASKVGDLIRRADQIGVRTLRIRLIRRLLVRLHNQIELLRVWIREHDADCDTTLHGPYERADELIAALNSKE